MGKSEATKEIGDYSESASLKQNSIFDMLQK